MCVNQGRIVDPSLDHMMNKPVKIRRRKKLIELYRLLKIRKQIDLSTTYQINGSNRF